jgi:hypothetical protein
LSLSQKEPGGFVKRDYLCEVKLGPNWKKKCLQTRGSVKQFDRRELEKISYKLITQKQELHFRKSRLINHESVYYVNYFSEQVSAYSSFPISSLSRVSPKSNMFYYIDQRQEHVGSEVTFSSEDG